MRRGFSMLLVLLFGLGPLSAALSASEDSGLPACCRRHGQHHCAIDASSGSIGSSAWDATPSFTLPPRCPQFPGFPSGPLTPAHALTASGANLPALLEQQQIIASIAANAPMQPAGAHSGRGPPEDIQPDKIC